LSSCRHGFAQPAQLSPAQSVFGYLQQEFLFIANMSAIAGAEWRYNGFECLAVVSAVQQAFELQRQVGPPLLEFTVFLAQAVDQYAGAVFISQHGEQIELFVIMVKWRCGAEIAQHALCAVRGVCIYAVCLDPGAEALEQLAESQDSLVAGCQQSEGIAEIGCGRV
jgi:hypothetical protein